MNFFVIFCMDKIFYLNSFFHLSPQMNLIMNRLLPVGGKLDYSLTVKLNPRASISSSTLLFNKILYVLKRTSEISLNYYNNFRYASVLRMNWGWGSVRCIWIHLHIAQTSLWSTSRTVRVFCIERIASTMDQSKFLGHF